VTRHDASAGPSPAVLAVIAAAADAVWQRPAAAPPDDRDPAHGSWRFSGRWWNKPIPLGRERPSA